MTPKQHLEAAEKLLAEAQEQATDPLSALAAPATQLAIAHALIAAAAELGVPHTTTPGGGAPGGN